LFADDVGELGHLLALLGTSNFEYSVEFEFGGDLRLVDNLLFQGVDYVVAEGVLAGAVLAVLLVVPEFLDGVGFVADLAT